MTAKGVSTHRLKTTALSALEQALSSPLSDRGYEIQLRLVLQHQSLEQTDPLGPWFPHPARSKTISPVE